ncbi:hypothetical protein B0H16DRAFT_128006 [Mycena metata]|uniref:Uncharacterized protein n=1 Tax=Mycena metata TaxID=1033252 RepID=A0AAD7MWI4_9AGAR|nr:hypothetical protein B0H16DRAFT_128006 [Mycena metata]
MTSPVVRHGTPKEASTLTRQSMYVLACCSSVQTTLCTVRALVRVTSASTWRQRASCSALRRSDISFSAAALCAWSSASMKASMRSASWRRAGERGGGGFGGLGPGDVGGDMDGRGGRSALHPRSGDLSTDGTDMETRIFYLNSEAPRVLVRSSGGVGPPKYPTGPQVVGARRIRNSTQQIVLGEKARQVSSLKKWIQPGWVCHTTALSHCVSRAGSFCRFSVQKHNQKREPTWLLLVSL